MQAIFDHLAAVIVGGGIMLIFALIQVRGTQSSAEAVINHTVMTEVMQLSSYLQRDIENMRTQAQTDEAISRGNFTGGAGYSCQLTTSGGLTTDFTFPTLADPEAAAGLADPDDAEVVLVSYRLTDTGKTITIPENGVDRTLPVYTLDRMVDGNNTGGSGAYIIHFLVEFANKGSSTFSSNSSGCSTNLARVRFELKVATEGVEWATNDQQSTSMLNISRYGDTVALANME